MGQTKIIVRSDVRSKLLNNKSSGPVPLPVVMDQGVAWTTSAVTENFPVTSTNGSFSLFSPPFPTEVIASPTNELLVRLTMNILLTGINPLTPGDGLLTLVLNNVSRAGDPSMQAHSVTFDLSTAVSGLSETGFGNVVAIARTINYNVNLPAAQPIRFDWDYLLDLGFTTADEIVVTPTWSFRLIATQTTFQN